MVLLFCWTALWNAAEAKVSLNEAGAQMEHALPGANDIANRRVALVIGNGRYANDALGNPVNDAREISRVLASFGFEVRHHENLDSQQMHEALLDFNRRLSAGGVGLFYFSGHGFQTDSKVLLAPVDADSRSPASLLTKSVDLQSVLEHMSPSRPGKLNLVILDTCMNNPFDSFHPVPAATIHVPAIPDETLIAYASAPGSFAADGKHHGVYTAALLQALTGPTQNIRQLLNRANASVLQRTAHRQIPWISSTLSREFRLALEENAGPAMPLLLAANNEEDVVTPRSRAILPKDSAEQYELTFWDSIKDSNHISDYEAYLNAYPKGRFAALARARIERLRATAPKAETPAEAPRPLQKAEPERKRSAPAAKESAERARPKLPAKTPPAKEEQAQPSAPAETPPKAVVGVSEVKDCPACPTLVALPGGSFTMGSNSSDPTEKPAHRVSIGAPFAIGKYEVTVEQWDACVAANACARIANGTDRAKNTPVRDVSWDDTQQYLKWLSQTTGKTYRLPTEAEWEYAARGGTSTPYWWGEKMRPGNANCKECGKPWAQEAPAAVGSFAANPFGLHDMNGSVWEWVSDCWHNSYKGAPSDGRSWDTPNCRDRVIRGGSWREDASYMLSSTRFKYGASVRYSQNGFRVARDMK
ncbi:MAG TPA: SUMF1/EgtB/PvdO family nonheme iron enzyme [Noviherbaspirillum sp.]|nr:SUMF1/EgtB/PvdO family nonheme iron enzyme [Noviherbaspirillum sp.]